MNILINTLPTQIKANNGNFEPLTDFRASIEFELMVEKGEQDIKKLLTPFFPCGLPFDLAGATDAVLWFYSCGIEKKQEKETQPKPTGKKRVYSFSVDAEAIYSDFWRFYNIDLSEIKLHWWKFRALLMGLPEDSSFKKRIYYRTCELKDLPKKEQKRIRDIRKEIEIKTAQTEHTTLAERNNKMLDYVKKRSAEVQSEVT